MNDSLPGSHAAAACAEVRAALSGPVRTARILHRGTHAVYLQTGPPEIGQRVLGVCAPGATHLPCAVALGDRLDLSEVRAVRVGGGAIELAIGGVEHTIRVARLVDQRVPGLGPEAGWEVARLAELLREPAGAAVAELGADPALHDPGSLLGRGSGLTPLGDDVLCGALAIRRALDRPIPPPPQAAQRTTALSAELLRCAAQGRVVPEFRQLCLAIRTGSVPRVEATARALAGLGHTSGAGLLLGAAAALQDCLEGARP